MIKLKHLFNDIGNKIIAKIKKNITKIIWLYFWGPVILFIMLISYEYLYLSDVVGDSESVASIFSLKVFLSLIYIIAADYAYEDCTESAEKCGAGSIIIISIFHILMYSSFFCKYYQL